VLLQPTTTTGDELLGDILGNEDDSFDDMMDRRNDAMLSLT
jgi:hypothetical protein